MTDCCCACWCAGYQSLFGLRQILVIGQGLGQPFAITLVLRVGVDCGQVFIYGKGNGPLVVLQDDVLLLCHKMSGNEGKDEYGKKFYDFHNWESIY